MRARPPGNAEMNTVCCESDVLAGRPLAGLAVSLAIFSIRYRFIVFSFAGPFSFLYGQG
jgi:hypothetical protein